MTWMRVAVGVAALGAIVALVAAGQPAGAAVAAVLAVLPSVIGIGSKGGDL